MTAVPVSVIIPTHNRAALLPRAVQSVLAQTVRVQEILIVDDASDHAAATVLASVDDPRIQHLRHPESRGGSAARNTGLQAATGTFVAFLDDDDTWSPDKVEKQYAAFAESDASVGGVFTYSCKVSPHDPTLRYVAKTPRLRLTFDDFLHKTFFGASVPLFRAACFEKVGGFDEALPSVQDRDMWLRIAHHFAFVGVPEVLVQNTIHGNQISSDLPRKIAGKELFLEKYYDDLCRHPKALAALYWRLGLMYCIDGSYTRGQQRLREALATFPDDPAPEADLQWSQDDPAGHARHLLAERFSRVGDVVLYY